MLGCKCFPPLEDRTMGPEPSLFLLVADDVQEVSLPTSTWRLVPAPQLQRNASPPVTQGTRVNSGGKKKTRRRGNQKITLQQTWTCGLSCSSPSGMVLQPWIWRRVGKCLNLSWRWVMGPLLGKCNKKKHFLLMSGWTLLLVLPHFLLDLV